MKRIKLAGISASADCNCKCKLVTVNLWRNSEQTETMDKKVNIYKININILISARKLKWKGRPNGAMRRVGNLLFLTQGLLASGSRTICPHSSPVERLLLFSRRQHQQQCFIMTEPGGGVVKKSLAEWSLAPSQLVARLPVDPDTENRIRRNVPGAVFSKGMCRLRMTIIGPCRVHQRNRSRAHQQQQEVPGSTHPDHERRAWA